MRSVFHFRPYSPIFFDVNIFRPWFPAQNRCLFCVKRKQRGHWGGECKANRAAETSSIRSLKSFRSDLKLFSLNERGTKCQVAKRQHFFVKKNNAK